MSTVKEHTFRVFAGKDNNTLDLGRILWALGTLVYFALSIHSVWHGTTFDPVAWGTGFGAVLAAGGAALWMKKDTEPESQRQAHRLDMKADQDHRDDNHGDDHKDGK